MMLRRVVVFAVVLCLLSGAAYAKPKGKKHTSKKSTAGERIADEAADAVVDVLTGTESQPKHSSGNLPPGLAKKDKTPPGWDKGKKTGWSKESHQKQDSPIRRFIKNLFKKDSDKTQSE